MADLININLKLNCTKKRGELPIYTRSAFFRKVLSQNLTFLRRWYNLRENFVPHKLVAPIFFCSFCRPKSCGEDAALDLFVSKKCYVRLFSLLSNNNIIFVTTNIVRMVYEYDRTVSIHFGNRILSNLFPKCVNVTRCPLCCPSTSRCMAIKYSATQQFHFIYVRLMFPPERTSAMFTSITRNGFL